MYHEQKQKSNKRQTIQFDTNKLQIQKYESADIDIKTQRQHPTDPTYKIITIWTEKGINSKNGKLFNLNTYDWCSDMTTSKSISRSWLDKKLYKNGSN